MKIQPNYQMDWIFHQTKHWTCMMRDEAIFNSASVAVWAEIPQDIIENENLKACSTWQFRRAFIQREV